MDTGPAIHRRYLLQRLIKQGTACAVYQGFDQVLQRAVTVKIAPAEQSAAYRAAIRTTAQFTHPNIIGLYDLIVEPDKLYIVQEYVDGDDFAALLQTQLAPYEVADLGMQICQALIYAGTPSRKVSHGDLTPSAIIRDRRGQVRVNNFALPTDMHYFTAWSVVGGNNIAVSDPDLPPGQMSDSRRADDTRAVGLLLYQLLTGHNPDAVSIDPPADGRLRFLRTVPPELCEVVARAIIRMHPQYINTPETLHAELKKLVELLEPPPAPIPAPARYPGNDSMSPRPTTQSGKLVAQMPSFENTTGEAELPPPGTTGARILAVEPAAPTVADIPLKLATARHAAYGHLTDIEEVQPRRINFPLLILVCLVLFALFFGIGYLLANMLIH